MLGLYAAHAFCHQQASQSYAAHPKQTLEYNIAQRQQLTHQFIDLLEHALVTKQKTKIELVHPQYCTGNLASVSHLDISDQCGG